MTENMCMAQRPWKTLTKEPSSKWAGVGWLFGWLIGRLLNRVDRAGWLGWLEQISSPKSTRPTKHAQAHQKQVVKIISLGNRNIQTSRCEKVLNQELTSINSYLIFFRTVFLATPRDSSLEFHG